MSPGGPWRLNDIKFQYRGDKRRGVIGPVTVIESGGRYSVIMESHNLRLAWHDLEEKTADLAINAALNTLFRANQPRRVGNANASGERREDTVHREP
jgi:hypothetical protein